MDGKASICESIKYDINDCPSCSVTQNKEWMSEDHYSQVVKYSCTMRLNLVGGTVFVCMCRAGLSKCVAIHYTVWHYLLN